MNESEIDFDPLSWIASPELDIAVDAICCEGDGITASRKWSWDEDTAGILYHPLAKSNKWKLSYTLQGDNKGWRVEYGDSMISHHPDIRVAMLRAVLKHHMKLNAEEAANIKPNDESNETRRNKKNVSKV